MVANERARRLARATSAQPFSVCFQSSGIDKASYLRGVGTLDRWSDQSGAPHSNKMGLLPMSSRRFAGTGNVLPFKFRY